MWNVSSKLNNAEETLGLNNLEINYSYVLKNYINQSHTYQNIILSGEFTSWDKLFLTILPDLLHLLSLTSSCLFSLEYLTLYGIIFLKWFERCLFLFLECELYEDRALSFSWDAIWASGN